MERDVENLMNERATATEDALLLLVDRLAMRGVISIDEGADVLQLMSRGNLATSDRLSQSLNLLSKLKQLRHADTASTPGAPTSGPVISERN